LLEGLERAVRTYTIGSIVPALAQNARTGHRSFRTEKKNGRKRTAHLPTPHKKQRWASPQRLVWGTGPLRNFGIIPKELDSDFRTSGSICNLTRASYLKNVIPVATGTSAKIIGSDAIRPDSVDATDLKQEVLLGSAYRVVVLRPANPEVLLDRDASVDFHIQSATAKVFSRSPSVCCAKLRAFHAFRKVSTPLNNVTF